VNFSYRYLIVERPSCAAQTKHSGVWEALIKAILGFIRARCAANAVCGLLQNQSLNTIDFAGTSLCRRKV